MKPAPLEEEVPELGVEENNVFDQTCEEDANDCDVVGDFVER